MVKIKNSDFSYWAWSTPWGHVLSLKTFCRNPVLSLAIRYSVFQPVKFSNSLEFVCSTMFSIFWHLVVKFGFLSHFKSSVFRFWWNICEIKKSLLLFYFISIFLFLSFINRNVTSNKIKFAQHLLIGKFLAVEHAFLESMSFVNFENNDILFCPFVCPL